MGTIKNKKTRTDGNDKKKKPTLSVKGTEDEKALEGWVIK